jgi:hypothetical protein
MRSTKRYCRVKTDKSLQVIPAFHGFKRIIQLFIFFFCKEISKQNAYYSAYRVGYQNKNPDYRLVWNPAEDDGCNYKDSYSQNKKQNIS